MKLIETLFDYIILQNDNSRGLKKNWLPNYRKITEGVAHVRAILENDECINIDDSRLYGTDNKAGSTYKDFMNKWLREKSNGVSSCGQSILSQKDFDRLIWEESFQEAAKEAILRPSDASYRGLSQEWKARTKNPLLVSRALAASNTSLTSVVNEEKFNKVVHYLAENCNYPALRVHVNWYKQNINLTQWLDEELKELFDSWEEEGLDDLDKILLRNIFVWEIYTMNASLFQLKKSIVRYGAPGTGKTYTCFQDTEDHFNYWKSTVRLEYPKAFKSHTEVVQFHPSYTYEDFMEGIKPVLKDGAAQLQLTNGVFKTFCKKAAQWEMDVYRLGEDIQETNWENIKAGELKGKVEGKHWSFLDGLRDDETIHQYIPPFYFIIDEINRAELSRVMGELMLCLEYRGYKGKIKTQYSSLVNHEAADTAFWFEENSNYFFIPNNVYILATMNTIDRSVESFDFALRRRFKWEEVGVNYDVLEDYLEDYKKLHPVINGLKALNKAICEEPLLGKDFQIGHAYLLNLPDLLLKSELKDFRNRIWSDSIQPLLEEYLRGTGDVSNKINDFWTAFNKNS